MNEVQIKLIGKLTTEYYNQIPFTPTDSDFKLWIDSLGEPMKTHFKKDGLKKCIGILNFKRFWLEMKDYGMIEFMKKNLSIEDYAEYCRFE